MNKRIDKIEDKFDAITYICNVPNLMQGDITKFQLFIYCKYLWLKFKISKLDLITFLKGNPHFLRFWKNYMYDDVYVSPVYAWGKLKDYYYLRYYQDDKRYKTLSKSKNKFEICCEFMMHSLLLRDKDSTILKYLLNQHIRFILKNKS